MEPHVLLKGKVPFLILLKFLGVFNSRQHSPTSSLMWDSANIFVGNILKDILIFIIKLISFIFPTNILQPARLPTRGRIQSEIF